MIDISNQAVLKGRAEYPELKITRWFERLQISPTRRATAILQGVALRPCSSSSNCLRAAEP